MQIGVLGINHKQADVTLREIISKACHSSFLNDWQTESMGLILLSTCNRTELYFSSQNPHHDLAITHQYILAILRREIRSEFEQKCYSFFGVDCFVHLAKVTAGLDSACPLETEIQGQVKTAYELAAKTQVLSPTLHFLFQKCLAVGKEIRTKYPLTIHAFGLEQIVLHLANKLLHKNLAPLFIGASAINVKIARFLQQKGIGRMTFCNRTKSKASLLANEFQGEGGVLPWEELQRRWIEYDWIISAVKSPVPILTYAPHIKPDVNKLLIDLGVPRNISPALGGSNYALYNIDAINELLEIQKSVLDETLQQAESTLIEACTRKLYAFQNKPLAYGPLRIKGLHAQL